jgi:hypothetical protein
MSFIGISNEHEFYSQHYLDEVFPEDLRNVLADLIEKDRKSAEKAKEDKAKGIKTDPWRAPWRVLAGEKRSGILADMREAAATASAAERIEKERSVIVSILRILDLPVRLDSQPAVLANGLPLPLLGEIKTQSNYPYLWILQATSLGGTADSRETEAEEGTDPLELCMHGSQCSAEYELRAEAEELKGKTWFEILSAGVFAQEASPRWVILASPEQWVLIDRMKFAQRRVLRFDWPELLERREEKTLQAVTALLGSKAFRVEQGQCLLEGLDENSHKHAYGVSQDLKYALRESIELLGNEAARQLREQAREKKLAFWSGLDAKELSDECLRYMYRLLFLFFVEARPDLNYAPVNSADYTSGYALESLRDLEMIPLVTEEEKNGTYLHESIEMLMRFFTEGTQPFMKAELQNVNIEDKAFEIEPLPSTLFDNSRMKLLGKVRFPNSVLQRVIELMSLSREGAKGRKFRRRGRISYAHLGLNQLGAVYEGLLSYSGFFAKEDLYEVKAKNGNYDVLNAAYFVPQEELHKYSDDEKVYDKDPLTGENRLRVYPKGTFIYRMAGRERENSASYYTPEVLTKCVVSESLDVLVKQQLEPLATDKEKAERILSWKICEPAMGSAAFLNEAINQVSDLYMQHASRIPDARKLSQEEWRKELQRVRMFIADRNVYGVDLNPTAVELAEVSLWLNALSDDKYIPWFGLQLACGNSLIGCRRQAYWMQDLKDNLAEAMPHDVGPEGLKPGEIWHFLVPNASMSLYKDTVVKSIAGEENFDKVAKWRKGFSKKLSEMELLRMESISGTIDALWKQWAEDRRKLDAQTSDSLTIYGHEEEESRMSYLQKNALVEQVLGGDENLNSGAYARLKLAMDYWNSLWFWPIDQAALLPTRLQFLEQMNAIVSGLSVTVVKQEEKPAGDFELRADQGWTPDMLSEMEYTKEEIAEQQDSNLERRRKAFIKRYPQLKVVDEVAHRMRFLHWELEFADVFLPEKGEKPGFDLTLGNPPWKVASWDASGVLSEANPEYIIHAKDYSAKGINDVLTGKRGTVDGVAFLDLERNKSVKAEWLRDYEANAGAKAFYNATAYYPELEGSGIDLFKLFLPNVWRHSAADGVQGLLHPDTVYTETKANAMRRALYPRVRKHYQFANELKLFADVHHETEFSINVYGTPQPEVGFESMNNLYAPQTIRLSRQESDLPVPGKKDEKGNWNLTGHPDRLIQMNAEALSSIGTVFGTGASCPMLPSIHARQLLEILEKFGNAKQRVGDVDEGLTISRMWDETNAKIEGFIREIPGNETVFPETLDDVILNGPHVAVGSPIFKTPDNPCENNLSWSVIDLVDLPEDYLPRVKYRPGEDKKKYVENIQHVSWPDSVDYDSRALVTDFYRLALRAFVPTDGERTLTAGIVPPGVSHTHIIETLAFSDLKKMILVAGCFATIPCDFFVRQVNKSNLLPALLRSIPLPSFSEEQKRAVLARTLCLNCLTTHYEDLWASQWNNNFTNETWSTTDARIPQKFFANLTEDWTRACALRSDLERRQALLELDVIVAQAFGMTLDELQTCYRLGFRVLRGYDQETYYDQNGRIIFTPNGNGLRGVGLPRKASANDVDRYAVDGAVRAKGLGFEDVKDKPSGTVSKTFIDDTLPGGPRERTITYTAPFFKMDREADYKQAWTFFESLKQTE